MVREARIGFERSVYRVVREVQIKWLVLLHGLGDELLCLDRNASDKNVSEP